MITQVELRFSGPEVSVIDCNGLIKLLGGSVVDITDATRVGHDGTVNQISAELICGTEVRPEWLLVKDADCMLLDGLSVDDIASDKYARFRSFLFDTGYVPIKRKIADHPREHVVYARSCLLSDPSLAGAAFRKSVSMKCLGRLGRFGNQLWQYLFIRMYGLRNGLTIQVPPWEGERIFGFSDERPCDDDRNGSMLFFGLDDDDLELWEIDNAPGDVDFRGFFQHVPAQWNTHREFIRRLYKLRSEWDGAIEQLNLLLRREGRTLVTIHVRRGDYSTIDHPYFRPVPTDWYRAVLGKMWPSLARPLLHVSTDEPAVKSAFEDYEQLDATFFARDFGIPEHVRDFSLLREADHLLACNSSFSIMAAVVGKPQQKCYLVDFGAQCFTAYDPWTDHPFGARFVENSRTMSFEGTGIRGARKRGLMMRSLMGNQLEPLTLYDPPYRPYGEFSPVRLLQSEVERLRHRVRYLEGAMRPRLNLGRYLHRVWRAIRCR